MENVGRERFRIVDVQQAGVGAPALRAAAVSHGWLCRAFPAAATLWVAATVVQPVWAVGSPIRRAGETGPCV